LERVKGQPGGTQEPAIVESFVGRHDGQDARTRPGTSGHDQRYLVQSVGRALDIVAFVADGPSGGLPVADISRMLGISKSSTLATVRTLVAHGYLRPVEPGPRYRLGMSLIRLGDLTARQFPIAEICTPVLREIAQQTRLTARAAVADEGFPLFVDRVDGPGTVRFHTPLGRREPAHATAAGKAILSTMDPGDIRAMFRATGLPGHTGNTITSVETLLRDLGTTREQGYSVDDEEDVMGVVCVGAAFFDHAGTCAGALSVTGLKADLPAERIADLGAIMRRYADNISVLAGGRRYADLRLAHADGTG
jgi:IclR family acetate operon transcriptional repressor